ncbi:MAG: Fe-S cluster assembly protein SufD [Muribaculaceae bacterium]|nr:Fe-S cluster assembly protein SufD [Muribaculaceae bacterium]
MNALEQYIGLYREYREVVERNAPAALNALRPAALDALATARLPRKGQEDYEAIDMEAIFAPDYGVNVTRLDYDIDPTESFRCDVPNLSTCLFHTYNDVPHISATSRRNLDGVVVETLTEATANHPDVLAGHLGRLARLDDPTVALNTLLAQDGLLVYVPDGVSASKPIQLLNILSAAHPTMVVRRLLVVAGKNAHVRLLACDHTQGSGTQVLNLQVIEVVAGRNATVDFYDLEESGTDTSRVSSLFVEQHEGSSVLVDGITLMNGITRNNSHVQVVGEHASTELLGMTIASGHQHVDTRSFVSHNVPRCTSNQMFKYVLADEAIGAFAGKVLIKEGCPRVEAYQGNRNLCASPSARMYTKPQLEIYTDDVKASHGTTIGQLDEEAMFYMRTRGVSQESARRLLMQAFMSDVIDGVRLDVLRDRLHYLVEKRFDGTLAACTGCAICGK